LKQPTLQMRVLQRCVKELGDERALARHLRVPQPELFAWLRGEDLPPHSIFLSAIDLLIDRSLPREPATEDDAKQPG
jgi:hypothetical protein